MTELIFATNNQNKVEEIRKVVDDQFHIITLKEAGIDIDIPEPHDTLLENAREKSSTIHRLTGKNCFSEDTGLFVEALNGEPGVRSARYAGEGKTSKDNIDKLLHELHNNPNRNAHFKTVISLIIDNQERTFEGVCLGKIIDAPRGDKGFGYDSIFIPDGDEKTFAEMDMEQKNKYSHRKKATLQLTRFLSQFGTL